MTATTPTQGQPGAVPVAPRNGWLDLSWHRVKIVARATRRDGGSTSSVSPNSPRERASPVLVNRT